MPHPRLVAVSLLAALVPVKTVPLTEDSHHELVDKSGHALKTAPVEAHVGLFRFPGMRMAELAKLTGSATRARTLPAPEPRCHAPAASPLTRRARPQTSP